MSRPTTHDAPGVPALPRRGLRRAALLARVGMTRRHLDVLLAERTDPWSSAALLTRAAQIVAPAHRRKVATALLALVELAEYRRPASPHLTVRASAVLRERATLLALAGRLHDAAPVDVAVVARLGLLVWDDLSPVYVGGRPVDELGTMLALCSPELVG